MDLNHKDILESREKLAKRLAEVEARLAALQSLSQERDILKQTIWGLDELLKKYKGYRLRAIQTTLLCEIPRCGKGHAMFCGRRVAPSVRVRFVNGCRYSGGR